MQTRPFSQRSAVVVVPEMLLHLIPAYLDAMRAGSLQQQGLSLHPGLQIHFEPVVERDGASRRRRLGELVVQGVAWMRGRGEGEHKTMSTSRAFVALKASRYCFLRELYWFNDPQVLNPAAAESQKGFARDLMLAAVGRPLSQLAAEVVQRSLESCKRQINSYSRINSQITHSCSDRCVRCAIVAMAQRLDGVCNSMCRWFVLQVVVSGLNSGYIGPGVRDWAPSA